MPNIIADREALLKAQATLQALIDHLPFEAPDAQRNNYVDAHTALAKAAAWLYPPAE